MLRRLALATTVLAAALAGPAYAGAVPDAGGPNHCDEFSVNALCLDQGDDGTIYQCLVWVHTIEPEDNPACFAIW